MTLVELRYIVSLADERHFGHAAAHCCVSQPTLSMAIKRLEKELGVSLFERTSTGTWPTPAGQEIVARARRALAHTEAISALARPGGEQTLKLGALPSLASGVLPRAVSYLHRRWPGQLALHLEQNDIERLGVSLQRGELDALLVVAPFARTDVVSRPLYDEPMVVLLPEGHPLAAHGAVAVEQLQQWPLLLPEAHEGARQALLALCPTLAAQLTSVTGRTCLGNAGTETVRQMVAQGAGISVVPPSIAGSAPLAAEGLLTRPFAGEAPVRTLTLAWRASFPLPPLMDQLVDVLQATAPHHWLASDEPATGLLVENGHW